MDPNRTDQIDRTDVLPWIILCLPTAPKEDLCDSSAGLVYCEPLTVPV